MSLINPAAGTYTVKVVGYAVPSGAASFKRFSWALGTAAAGSMTVTAPASATVGQTATIGIVTSNLTPGTRYLGSVSYRGAAGLPDPAIIRIDG